MTIDSPHLALGAALALAVALAPAGCSSGEDLDQPKDDDYDQMADGFGPAVSRSVTDTTEVATDIARGDVPDWLSGGGNARPGHARAAAEQTYTGSAGSLTWEIGIECTGADGASLDACDERTDGAAVEVSLTGSLDLPGVSGALDMSGEWSLSGLQGETVSTTAATTVDVETEITSVTGTTRRLELAVTADYDLEVPVGDPAAATGSATATVEAWKRTSGGQADAGAHFLVAGELAFDGSGTAELTFDGRASYNLELDSGAVSRM